MDIEHQTLNGSGSLVSGQASNVHAAIIPMLESLTIYSKGGLIFYQYLSSPSLVKTDDSAAHSRRAINAVQPLVKRGATTFHIQEGLTFCWKDCDDFFIMVLYPDIIFETPRTSLKTWAEALINRTCTEYRQYCEPNNSNISECTFRPGPLGFDFAFCKLLEQSRAIKQDFVSTSSQTSISPLSSTTGSGSSHMSKSAASIGEGKNQRHWIGSTKVNSKIIAQLDHSSPEESVSTAESEEQRLKDARNVFLPTALELERSLRPESSKRDASISWGSTLSALFQNLNMNKVLTEEDIAKSLKGMQQVLVEKNVASSIAAKLCASVEKELVGKKLNSMYRIQTAVQQGIKKAVRILLEVSQVDLLRLVLARKESSGWFGGGSGKKKPPFVVCVLGINGIGKTTTVAKLAYFFQMQDCKVLLVAGDTFRSGAVEQLKTHALCLACDIFSLGYSKDPAAVAIAALQFANEPSNSQYDVILIDTAGRMQNNAPLMNALTKLVTSVRIDFTLLIAEALVGHDALSQFNMFRKAVRTVNGIVLTKYDTVGSKVGAALTLTHETGTPIVFLGTGQKYHHLQPLNVESVITSLFSN